MMIRLLATVPCFCVTVALAAADDSYQIKALKEAPKGLSPKIAEALNPKGLQIVGPDGPVCDLWFLKTLEMLPGFQPSAAVQYGLKPGQLVGAMRLTDDASFVDFRGQELQRGTHTIRYAHQPIDGNHAAPMRDFLLALPPALDTDPAAIEKYEDLTKKSMQSGEGEHPVIISLLSPGKPAETPALTHDEQNDFWILNVSIKAVQEGKDTTIPFRLVVVGTTDE